MFRHILRCPPSIVSAAVQPSAETRPEESRRELIGRPEGRPRPERVLKDARAPPSFRTDPCRGRASARAITRRKTPPRPFSASCYCRFQPSDDVVRRVSDAHARGSTQVPSAPPLPTCYIVRYSDVTGVGLIAAAMTQHLHLSGAWPIRRRSASRMMRANARLLRPPRCTATLIALNPRNDPRTVHQPFAPRILDMTLSHRWAVGPALVFTVAAAPLAAQAPPAAQVTVGGVVYGQ